jgi:hypothetical protein
MDKTGRISWVSDLAGIPAKDGVTNVYGDLGQLFAYSTVAQRDLLSARQRIHIKLCIHRHQFAGRPLN